MLGEEAVRLRQEYEAEGLDETAMAPDPFSEFTVWFDGALTAGIAESNAFVLATVDADGTPSARAVLMKELDSSGLVFYTGMTSRKSAALRAHPVAAGTFVWIPLHRQVRFEGRVGEVPGAVADAYFATRPRGAQIAAHASNQSELVGRREDLDERFAVLLKEFGDDPVPRPDKWGGWCLQPTSVEFWQGRPNRFHDRVRYRLDHGGWSKERLAP